MTQQFRDWSQWCVAAVVLDPLLSYDQGNVQRRDEDLDGTDLLDGKQDDFQY